jgi:hypothetical protein
MRSGTSSTEIQLLTLFSGTPFGTIYLCRQWTNVMVTEVTISKNPFEKNMYFYSSLFLILFAFVV